MIAGFGFDAKERKGKTRRAKGQEESIRTTSRVLRESGDLDAPWNSPVAAFGVPPIELRKARVIPDEQVGQGQPSSMVRRS